MYRRMTQLTIVALVLAVLVGALPEPSAAVTGNFEEDFAHPFVGLVVFYDETGEFLHRCSGSLLTPIVLLTAGHCTAGATSARVYFQQDAGAEFNPETGIDPTTGYPETCIPEDEPLCVTSHELYNYGFEDFAGFPNTKDLGLVILDEPVLLDEYAALAAAGTLDHLATRRGKQDVRFTISGYGVTDARVHPPSRSLSFRERLMTEVKLVNLRNALTGGFNLQLSGNPGGGRGGLCFGDSGGPIFYPADSNVIVGVSSFVINQWCAGLGFSYRTDTEEAIAWILETVPESERDDIQIVSRSAKQAAKPAAKRNDEDRNGRSGKDRR
jgi:hypothetical protein